MKRSITWFHIFLLISIIYIPVTISGSSILTVNPDDSQNSSFLSLLDSADIYLNDEKWDKAESFIERMLRAEPGNAMNVMLLANLANVKFSLDKYDEALTLADVVLSRAPESIRMLNLKGKILLAEDRIDEATDPLEKSLAIDSTQIQTGELLGAIYMAQGEDQKGLECYGRLHALQPENPHYLKPIAGTLLQQNRYDEAEETYRKILAIGDDPEAYTYLTSILILTDNIPDAVNIIRKALEKYPDNGNLYALRALIYRIQYQPQEAQAAFNLAKKYNAEPQFIELFSPSKHK